MIYRLILASEASKVKIVEDSNGKKSVFIPTGPRSHLGRRLDTCFADLKNRGVLPTDTAREFAWLASLVYVADTGISRKTESQDSWTREIELVVPVRTPEKWRRVTNKLEKLLKFLTGDLWSVEFTPAPQNREPLTSTAVSPQIEWSGVSLFSGGLDSFIGAINKLSNKESPLFLGHYWDAMTSSYQELCAKHLSNHFNIDGSCFLRFRIGFDGQLFPDVGGESTQRSRSFLFFALGIMAASGLPGEQVLTIPENGFIALNVPLEGLRLGAWSTRTTHPFYLGELNSLLESLEMPIELSNPFCFRTKGEMVSECSDPEFLSSRHGVTMSCSSPTKARWKKLPPMHCGYCVPCIIRRASLTSVGDETQYSIEDLESRVLDSTLAEGQHIRSFQVLAHRLRENPHASKFLILKPGPIPANDRTKWSSVFLRGLKEVEVFLNRVETKPL